MSRDTRMRNDDLALCLWAHDVRGGISRKPLEIESWVQRTTNRKWPILSPMVTWPMTSRDPERSRSWPRYVWCPLSRKWLEIATWWQCSDYRKWPPGNQIVTWPMTSHDPEMSSWPKALRGQYLENDWRYRLCYKGSPIGQVMPYVESNGHVLDYVTCPVFLFVTQCVFYATFRVDKITWNIEKQQI